MTRTVGCRPDGRARYEALRAYVLGQGPLDFAPVGLGVLYQHGMAAWMAHESSATARLAQDRSAMPTADVPALRQDSWRMDVSASGLDLIRLLAGTALLTVQGRRA